MNSKKKRNMGFALSLIGSLALAVASANAAVIAAFDVNDGSDTNNNQSGYAGLSGDVDTATQNGITLSYIGGSGDRDRDRGTGGNVALSPVPDVTRDYVHTDDGRGFAIPYVSVDLNGLLANTVYSFRWHHYENSSTDNINRLALYLDSNNDNDATGETKLFETGSYASDTSNYFTDFIATTDALGELHLVAGAHSAGRSINHLNGFEVLEEVVVVPVPGALPMGLVLLALAATRRGPER